jgi:hypothetical protein
LQEIAARPDHDVLDPLVLSLLLGLHRDPAVDVEPPILLVKVVQLAHALSEPLGEPVAIAGVPDPDGFLGQTDDGVAMDTGEARGPVDATDIGHVVEHVAGLLVGQAAAPGSCWIA